MKDVYVLVERNARLVRMGACRIICIADDFERCSLEMSKYSAERQESMAVENYDLLEDGD